MKFLLPLFFLLLSLPTSATVETQAPPDSVIPYPSSFQLAVRGGGQDWDIYCQQINPGQSFYACRLVPKN